MRKSRRRQNSHTNPLETKRHYGPTSQVSRGVGGEGGEDSVGDDHAGDDVDFVDLMSALERSSPAMPTFHSVKLLCGFALNG